MINISFRHSPSKYYVDANRVAKYFNSYSFVDDQITVHLSIKEVFEMWEYFELLFFTVIDWKGTYIEIWGMKFYSHNDKIRVFHSIQQAHSSLMNTIADNLQELPLVYRGDITLEELERRFYIESELDKLLDTLFPDNPNENE